MTVAVRRRSREIIPLLAAAMRAHDRAMRTCPDCDATWIGHDTHCEWCTAHRRAQAEFVLKPPAPRRYGYASADDLATLGIDPAADRAADLAAWADDLELAVGAGLITDQQARNAWDSRTI